ARHSRPRSHHPHQRRAAAVELPAVAGGLQRARIRADLLAGLRPRRARTGDPRIPPARAPVRRSPRQNRILTAAATAPRSDPGGPGTAAPAHNLVLRVLSSAVLAPVAIWAAYAGGWAFALFWTLAAIAVLWEWIALVAGPSNRLMFFSGAIALAVAALVADRNPPIAALMLV